MDRRNFLKGLGAVTIAAPVISLLPTPAAVPEVMSFALQPDFVWIKGSPSSLLDSYMKTKEVMAANVLNNFMLKEGE